VEFDLGRMQPSVITSVENLLHLGLCQAWLFDVLGEHVNVGARAVQSTDPVTIG
jgi:hypothetical protein